MSENSQSQNNLPEDFQPEELVGKLFADRYEIISLLGQGGMGAVYKAQHVYMKRKVAVKMLLPGTILTESGLKRFRKEAQAASALQHPNVVTVHEFDISEKFQTFMVMDFIEGHDLKEELDRNGPLSQHRFVHIFEQACAALAHAHKHGVIHRDIKDTNIMLLATEDDPDFVKIVDFGLARIMGEEGDPAQRLTETGAWLGTPLFMSPEQCRGMKCDERSDIYSLGCVMYEALCGQLPFKADNMLDIMHKHVREFPPPMGVVAPQQRITRTMEQIVSKCLAKEPASRYQSMTELKAELMKLQSFNAGAPQAVPPTTPALVQPGTVVGTGAASGGGSGAVDGRDSSGNARRSTGGSKKTSASHSKSEAKRKARMLYWVAAIVAIGLSATALVSWSIMSAQNIASQRARDATVHGGTVTTTVEDASVTGGGNGTTMSPPQSQGIRTPAPRRGTQSDTETRMSPLNPATTRADSTSQSASQPARGGAGTDSAISPEAADTTMTAGSQPATPRPAPASSTQPAKTPTADPGAFNNEFFNHNPFERSAPSRNETTISQPASQPTSQPTSSTPSSETPQGYPPPGFPQPPPGHPFPPPGFPPPPPGPDGKPPAPPPGAPLTR